MHFDGIKEPKTVENAHKQQQGETSTKRPDAPTAGPYDIKQWLYWSY